MAENDEKAVEEGKRRLEERCKLRQGVRQDYQGIRVLKVIDETDESLQIKKPE